MSRRMGTPRALESWQLCDERNNQDNGARSNATEKTTFQQVACPYGSYIAASGNSS